MLENSDNLNDLFKNWIKYQEDFDENNTGVFVPDGYIDEDKFKQSKKKILFILKEAHYFKGDKCPIAKNQKTIVDSQVGFYKTFFEEKSKDNRIIYNIKNDIVIPEDWANPEEKNKRRRFKLFDNKVKQKEKIARMAKYILDKEITSEYEELKDALSQVAFMNINKRGGKDSTYGKELSEYYDEYEEFILKEIDIIKPEIIVLMTNGSCVESKLLEKLKNIRIIPMVHTGLMPQYTKLEIEEEEWFNQNIATKYDIKNFQALISNYKVGKDNVFNKEKNGPFLKFNKSTLKYLIKFINAYENTL